MPPGESIRELISLIRDDSRNRERDNNELRLQVDAVRDQIKDTNEDLRERLDRHAEDERRRYQELEDFIRREVVLALPKACLANDVASQLRTITHNAQKEIEDRKRKDEINKAVQDATGPHRLPPPPFPLPGPTRDQSGSFQKFDKIDDDSIMPTPAQGRWLKRRWEWVKNNKIATGLGTSSVVGWLGHTPLWSAIKAAAKAAWQVFGG